MSTFAPLQRQRLRTSPAGGSTLTERRVVAPMVPSVLLLASSEQQGQLAPESRFEQDFTRIPAYASAPISEPTQRKKNTTGLPDTLKARIEALSGMSLDDVHVHYHSSKPAQVQAVAYTQGVDIHVGPGQERHLAHEAWHVVQQKQGRVKPTMQAKGVAINDDEVLEREADGMGAKSVQNIPVLSHDNITMDASIYGTTFHLDTSGTIQRVRLYNNTDTNNRNEKEYIFALYRTLYSNIPHLLYIRQQIENEILNKKQGVDPPLAYEHITEITQVINSMQIVNIESASQGLNQITVSGNVVLDNRLLGVSPIFQAGFTNQENVFELSPTKPENRLSKNDAEGKALTYLLDLVDRYLPEIHEGRYLDINIQGSNGPCNGCKERIMVYINEIIQKIRTSDFFVKPIFLRVSIYYHSEPTNVVRGAKRGRIPVPTTYGYEGDLEDIPDKTAGTEVFTHTIDYLISPFTQPETEKMLRGEPDPALEEVLRKDVPNVLHYRRLLSNRS